MKKKYIVLIILSLVILLAFSAYKYIYQDHRDINSEEPEFVLKSSDLTNQFSENIPLSEKKFLNKTLEVSGSVSEINFTNKSLIIDNNIFCQFQNPISNTIKTDSNITVKGRCIGYDDLLEEIKLDQCSMD